MKGQAIGLFSVKFEAVGTRTIGQYVRLWIIAENVEVAARKAKRVLKKDGGSSIVIKAVESHGTVDAF